MDLFLSIDLPKVEDIAHVPPPFPDCGNWAAPHKSNCNQHVYYSSLGFGKDNHGPMTELNTNTSEYLTEAILIMVCDQYKNKYIKLLERIETIKRNITYKIEKVMPRLMPNENAIIYGKETQSDGSRQKRAIPLGLIFSGVSAIGGLIMKGINTWTNYKKMALRQYLHYYQNYDVTLDHFLTGLDALGTGRLMFQVLDPDELDRFLSAIRRQLREERSPFELAFNHTYQFYAEPMVMFTNTHDQLLVNVPILLRLTTQKPLNLYSIDTLPMPFDTETLDGKNNEYTFINNSYPYMVLNEHNYIPLTETQLRMCDKMGSTYYCQNSYVLHQRTQHTCESAIYYKMDAKTITKYCQVKFAANVEFTPKVLDAGETMVLFNLPRPWILLCGQEKQPTEIEFATYKVVDRKECCECSLTAGSFQLDETLVKCTPEINSEADGHFKSYFAINKIIFDYLQAEKDVQLDSTVVQALSRLLDVKPEYDWMPLNWYMNPDLPDNVINQQPLSVIADLMGVMEHIITEGEEEAYQSEIQYRNA